MAHVCHVPRMTIIPVITVMFIGMIPAVIGKHKSKIVVLAHAVVGGAIIVRGAMCIIQGHATIGAVLRIIVILTHILMRRWKKIVQANAVEELVWNALQGLVVILQVVDSRLLGINAYIMGSR